MPQYRVFVILALIITIHSAMADINYEILADNDHPGKCVIKTSKGKTIIDSYEAVQHPTKCARVECGWDGWALIYTCDIPNPPKECVAVQFPHCCQINEMCNEV
ncbi:hypothetical protein KR032_006653 [Drosophila birchii]|nr:hypothetical protein KR032_006653 [Drosophila birchii]